MEKELKLNWILKTFDLLSAPELYQLLRLRSEVFVVEQRCNFQDMDNKDQHCFHLLGYQGDQLIAYARLVPPGLSYEYPAIGRVLVARSGRGSGLGAELILLSIEHIEKLYGKMPIRIGAQLYLKAFYESFLFKQSGDIYLEDEIEHIEMTRD